MNLIDNTSIRWKNYNEGNKFGYPINYSDSILTAKEDGRLEILVKWEPNCFCHFHKHTAETSSIVLQGELHVTDICSKTGKEISKRIRKVGDFSHKEPGDLHMEQGGPEGAIVLFSIYAPHGDGELAQALNNDREVLSTSTMKKILDKRLPLESL
jgi:quercetin dioxygenase-like cupin family protein